MINHAKDFMDDLRKAARKFDEERQTRVHNKRTSPNKNDNKYFIHYNKLNASNKIGKLNDFIKQKKSR